jgi:hypothetical protein
MTTVFDVTLRAAGLCKNVRRGAATGGSTASLVDSGAAGRPDDYYNGGTLWVISGDYAGKSLTITDFVGSSGTFSFATQTGLGVSAGDTYAALPATFTREALIAALNLALTDGSEVQISLDIPSTGASAYTMDGSQGQYRYLGRPFRVEVIASGETEAKPHFWWTAEDFKLLFDKNLPAAGDTIRLHAYDSQPSVLSLDIAPISASVDLGRLAWLVIYYACVPLMQQAENTDPTLKDLFGIASAMRAEFQQRSSRRVQARTPHLANW